MSGHTVGDDGLPAADRVTDGGPARRKGLEGLEKKTPWTPRGRRWALLLTLGLTVGGDRISKRIAERVLPERDPIDLFGGVLRFQLAENRGAFLGLGGSLPGRARAALFVVAVGLGLAGALAFLLRERDWPVRRVLAAGLVLGGGLGNLIDRIARGRVTDFLVLTVGPLHTGIFNLADVAILAGGAWLLLQSAEGVNWRGKRIS